MECATIVSRLEDGPSIMVHRGWRPRLEKDRSIRAASSKKASRANSYQAEMDETCEDKEKRDARKSRSFQFINTTKLNESRDNVNLQKTVRQNARKQRTEYPSTLARASASRNSMTTTTSAILSSRAQTIHQPSCTIPCTLGLATSLMIFTYPITMSAQAHSLLSTYLSHVSTRMFPPALARTFSHNPLRSPDWFRYAVHDEAMLCAMLYSAAVYLVLLVSSSSSRLLVSNAAPKHGTNKNRQMLYWQGRTLSIISHRIASVRKGAAVEDSTLGAISCLALGEAVLGHKEQWHVHMRGLRHLLLERSRSSFQTQPTAPTVPLSISMATSRLGPVMRTKLCRSDITGAIDYNLSPHLSFLPSSSLSSGTATGSHTWSYLPSFTLASLSRRLSSVFSSTSCSHSIIDPNLHDTLKILVYFIHATSSTTSAPTSSTKDDHTGRIKLDPYTFSSDLYAIQSALLTPPLLSPANAHRPLSPTDLLYTIQSSVQKALRLAAILYLKSIVQEFPHSFTGPTILLSQLKDALAELYLHLNPSLYMPTKLYPQSEASFSDTWTKQKFSVCRWMSAIGALVSEGETRLWFVNFLSSNLILHERISTQDSLEALLNLERVFGTSDVKQLWIEVDVLNRQRNQGRRT